MRALLLGVREEGYAVALDAVLEVLELRGTGAPTPVPGGPAALLGVLNVRGRVVPVLDTARLLGLPGLAPAERLALAVVGLARGRAALVSSRLPRTEVLGRALGASTLATAAGRWQVPGGVTTLLDVEATLAPERIAR